tara:strand:- start:4919 stop:5281 length:363 start_codon:yes stop_codon:yes gene_type:complete
MAHSNIFSTTGTSTTGCSSLNTTLSTGTGYIASTGTTIYGGLTLNSNSSSMNQQVKVAVFRVERNKHNEIKSSTFITEMWIEKKPGISIDYAVAIELKELAGGNLKADEIVIKEIFTVTL